MTLHIQLLPLLAIIAGVISLVVPTAFRFAVAAYLIAVGVISMLR